MERIEEDEIDLRELFKTIWNKKLFILIFTSIITLVAIIYAYKATPIFKGEALIEIGSYKTNDGISTLDNPQNLTKKLNVLYIEILQNKKDRLSEITNITVPKNTKEFIKVVSEGTSNESVQKEINTVLNYIQVNHQKILDEIVDKKELSLKNVTEQIRNLKEIEIFSYKQNIARQEKVLNFYQNELLNLNKIIKEIENKDSSLTALKLMEKSQIFDYITKIEIQLFETKSQLNHLSTNTLTYLEEKQKKISSLLLDYNYKNSQIVGEIIISDHPIKPKKKLIVVVAFVTGFVLSIFLVFFMAFISSMREDSKKEEENNEK